MENQSSSCVSLLRQDHSQMQTIPHRMDHPACPFIRRLPPICWPPYPPLYFFVSHPRLLLQNFKTKFALDEPTIPCIATEDTSTIPRVGCNEIHEMISETGFRIPTADCQYKCVCVSRLWTYLMRMSLFWTPIVLRTKDGWFVPCRRCQLFGYAVTFLFSTLSILPKPKRFDFELCVEL